MHRVWITANAVGDGQRNLPADTRLGMLHDNLHPALQILGMYLPVRELCHPQLFMQSCQASLHLTTLRHHPSPSSKTHRYHRRQINFNYLERLATRTLGSNEQQRTSEQDARGRGDIAITEGGGKRVQGEGWVVFDELWLEEDEGDEDADYGGPW
ncbi:hypothetical protein EDD21DRAFT_437342 [Dissophora ornata]|nr:hypothetical protein EDD21DRAFT_437342 [Dissophora ornata]